MIDPTPPGPRSEAASSDERGRGRHLRDYWRVLLEQRWVLLTCLVVTVATVAIVTFLSTPIYKASTTLQIERQGPDILTFKDVMGSDSSFMSYQDFYQTQYKILQSRSVIRLAAARLDLANRPEFTTRKGTPIGRLVRWAAALGASGSTPGSAESPADALAARAEGFVKSNLTVSPVRNSQLVEVSFSDRDAKMAAEVASAVAEAYLQFTYQSRYGMTAQATEFLTKQVARIQGEVSKLEQTLQEYSARKNIMALNDGTQNISEKALGDVSSRYTEAKGRLALAEARYKAVKGAPPDALPEVMNSVLIGRLREQRADIERQRSKMSERFKTDWPPLLELNEELAKATERLELEEDTISRQVEKSARNDYERAQAESDNLAQLLDKEKDKLQQVNKDAIEYASLKAEIENKRRVLSDLITRESQTNVSDRLRDTTASNIRIVDPAETPRAPVRPNKPLNLALSLVLGLGLGAGMAFFFDYLDNTVKNEDDVHRATGLATLGRVPFVQPLRVVSEGGSEPEDVSRQIDLASHLDGRSSTAEAFKNIRTSLLLASPERPPRQILVTSCDPQAGKSTVSLNLAIVLTQLGRRVLLIDADLRRPRLHRALGLSNDVGLSSFLSGNAGLDDVVQTTEIPRLMVVTSGPVPPNPSELLVSPALDALLEQIRSRGGVEHVLLDSPPLLSVADPVILATRMDASLIVVRSGRTGRESLSHGVGRIRQSQPHALGAILNAVSEEEQSYYYGRYRYYSQGETSTARTGQISVAARLRRRSRRRAGQV